MAEVVGSIVYDLDLDDKGFKSKLGTASGQAKSFGDHVKDSALQLAALGAVATVALQRVVSGMMSAVDAAVRQQNALLGLNSIANAFGQNANLAEKAARDLAADGLMPLGDAAQSLKNLLAAGFSLDQAIVLMNRFKDSAAFGRQGALAFGQSIVGATEGIKNGNSILVDNAGVTKNLSVILQEAGFSAQDLMKASSDAGVRMAIFNGILKETNPMLGDAAKLSESFGGGMARLQTQTFNLKAAIGEALQPMLTKLLDIVSPLIDKFIKFAKDHPQVVAAITAIAVAGLAFVAFLGLLGGLVGALMNLAPLFAAIGGIIAGITAPALAIIAGIIVAVIAVVMAMKQHWDTIVNLFNQYLKPALDIIWLALKQLWESLVELWNTLSPVLIPVLKVLGVVLLVIVGILIGAVIVALWLVINVVHFLVEVFNVLANVIGAVVRFIWNGIQWWWQNTVNAFNSVIGWINNMINTFRNIVGAISGALSGVWNAITEPFRRALDWVIDKVNQAVNKLKDLNPFQRHSPSLVDMITKGTNRIASLYGTMFNQLDAMSAGSRDSLLAGVGAAANNTNVRSTTNTQIGQVNISSREDADYFISQLNRDQELEQMGLSPRIR